MKKSILYPLLGIALLIAVVLILKSIGVIGSQAKEPVETDIVTKRNIKESINANGKIQPQVEVKVSSDVSGEILVLNVKEGDEVTEGQVLAKIQQDIYIRNKEKMEATVRNAEASVEQAKAQLLQSELSYNRSKRLWEKEIIPDSEYEQTMADYNVAKASVNASKASLRNAKASLNEAEDNLSRTIIYAPTSGTISQLNVEKGERVVGTGQFEGTEMMTIANLHAMEAVVEVNENDIIKVSYNDTANIEIDAYPKKVFKGIVNQIANSANSDELSADQITNFEVKISILPESYNDIIPDDNPKFFPFRPGMSASVEIETDLRTQVLSAPIQAVTIRVDEQSKERKEVAFIADGDTARKVNVEVGIQDEDYIEIKSGIDLNQTVITGPYNLVSQRLTDGMLIEQENKEIKTED